MSYHDAWQAEADWFDSTDADTLFDMHLLRTAPEYCPECKCNQIVYDDPIEGSTDIMRECRRGHQWRVKKEDQ